MEKRLGVALHLEDPRLTEFDRHGLRAVELLLQHCPRMETLNSFEEELAARGPGAPLLLRLAIKLARSKILVNRIRRPLHVSIVFAVYKEHTRMLPADQHPHGEDCLVRKIDQLRWLFDNGAPVTWDLFIVDDGCPEGSGRLAQQILEERCATAPARVLFLADAIHRRLSITRPMQSTSDSQKGGSIVYGMWTAAQQCHDRHIIVYTDADLSTNLGQTGLLLDEIVRGKKEVAIGSRRTPESVVVKKGQRNARGKLFIYLWKGLIPVLRRITDTQCGFKAFGSDVAREVISDLHERGFAFDIELLLKSELRSSGAIGRIPVAWIDSEAASTTSALQPYLPMLRSVVHIYREYLPSSAEADRLAGWIESLTEDEWRYLADHVPEAIAGGDPSDFDRIRPISLEDLMAVAGRWS